MLPVKVRASIKGGKVEWGGRTLQLPIRGSGEVSIAYLDDSLRVLCSSTGVAVQVRQDVLQKLLA